MSLKSSPGFTVAMLIGCQGAITTGLMVLVPIMPLFMRDLMEPTASAADVTRWSSVALAAPAVGALLCAPFAARWCERYGYRRTLLLSLSVFVAGLTTMALSHDTRLFIAARVLQGASMVSVIVTAFIARVSEPARCGRAFGTQESAVAAGALAGPVLGGVLQDFWSVRPLLLLVAAATGLAVLVLGCVLSEPSTPLSPARSEPERVRSSLFADFGFLRWAAAASLTQAGAFGLVNVFALFIDAQFAGAASLASTVGLLHALGWLATLIAGPLWGARNDRHNPARQFIAAALGCAGALALLPFAIELWQVGVLRFVQGACFAALAQSMLLVCARSAPRDMQGRVTVVAKSAMVSGQLLGPLAVLLFLPLAGPAATLWLTALMFVSAAALVCPEPVMRFSSLPDSR